MKKHKAMAIILGGGKGTRLYPLTKDRAKPAVPFAGKYRLVDIPISNCINSEVMQIYLLTQFNSASLHNHITNTYKFGPFTDGFVEILAAEQTITNNSWYQGTADAVRKNLVHFKDQQVEYYIILSGDQLYRMDFKEALDHHIASGAEITIAAKPISRKQATGLGIIGADEEGVIKNFLEKPSDELDISQYKVPDKLMMDSLHKHVDASNEYLASMGIYIFNAQTMDQVLDNDLTDFGREIIPQAIKERKVCAYLFDQFWEDIGTIKAFYETNLNLASMQPEFNFYDEDHPIYTHRRHLPATKLNFCNISSSLTSEGSIITNAYIVNSIIGVRTIIESGASLDGVYCMGASKYETPDDKKENARKHIPNLGIGKGTLIRKAIIDQNARIGNGCRIGIDDFPRDNCDKEMYSIRDGIIVITKNAIIPDNTVL
ncbi:MAG: glucose-1-phosphate adenylyltransferase [Spirochaetia bacterium]|jgi:glucose-1-phosphate adenylyltransferase|nr:glucose-1-phosphate adenylyltransferase [Spirochaetia bacterium]